MRRTLYLVLTSMILLSGCAGSMDILVPPDPKKSAPFEQIFTSEEPYQVVYKRILDRCYGWTPGRFGEHGRPYISHEVFSDLKEAVICRSLSGEIAGMVTWKIEITAADDGGCVLHVSAVNGDHWRNVCALVTACLTADDET